MDFRTPFSESCRFRSDLARDGAFLGVQTGQCMQRKPRRYTATHWNISMIVVFAVSRTPLSASSSAATSDGTCARNKMLCSLVIWNRRCELYVLQSTERKLTVANQIMLISLARAFLPTKAVPRTCASTSCGAAIHRSVKAWEA